MNEVINGKISNAYSVLGSVSVWLFWFCNSRGLEPFSIRNFDSGNKVGNRLISKVISDLVQFSFRISVNWIKKKNQRGAFRLNIIKRKKMVFKQKMDNSKNFKYFG